MSNNRGDNESDGKSSERGDNNDSERGDKKDSNESDDNDSNDDNNSDNNGDERDNDTGSKSVSLIRHCFRGSSKRYEVEEALLFHQLTLPYPQILYSVFQQNAITFELHKKIETIVREYNSNDSGNGSNDSNGSNGSKDSGNGSSASGNGSSDSSASGSSGSDSSGSGNSNNGSDSSGSGNSSSDSGSSGRRGEHTRVFSTVEKQRMFITARALLEGLLLSSMTIPSSGNRDQALVLTRVSGRDCPREYKERTYHVVAQLLMSERYKQLMHQLYANLSSGERRVKGGVSSDKSTHQDVGGDGSDEKRGVPIFNNILSISNVKQELSYKLCNWIISCVGFTNEERTLQELLSSWPLIANVKSLVKQAAYILCCFFVKQHPMPSDYVSHTLQLIKQLLFPSRGDLLKSSLIGSSLIGSSSIGSSSSKSSFIGSSSSKSSFSKSSSIGLSSSKSSFSKLSSSKSSSFKSSSSKSSSSKSSFIDSSFIGSSSSKSSFIGSSSPKSSSSNSPSSKSSSSNSLREHSFCVTHDNLINCLVRTLFPSIVLYPVYPLEQLVLSVRRDEESASREYIEVEKRYFPFDKRGYLDTTRLKSKVVGTLSSKQFTLLLERHCIDDLTEVKREQIKIL